MFCQNSTEEPIARVSLGKLFGYLLFTNKVESRKISLPFFTPKDKKESEEVNECDQGI